MSGNPIFAKEFLLQELSISDILPQKLISIMSTEVDWAQQWATHAPEFRNGQAHVCLPNQKILKLFPGPGFGDFSHPTTQLVIELMPQYVADQIILDIGCGSGILSVAADKMGASEVYACDIDPEALLHTQKNAAANASSLSTSIPKAFACKPVILMNMISSEQDIAWQEHAHPFTTLITSGILASDKTSYLAFAKQNHWQLIKIRESNGWLGCVFKENTPL